jgi:hypothetical protein
MQRCVYDRKKNASLKPVENLFGQVTQPSGQLLLEQHMARLRSSGCKNRSVRTLHTEKQKTKEKFTEF